MKKQEKKKREIKKQSNKKNILLISIITFIVVVSGFLLYGRFIATTGLIVKEYKITNSSIPNDYHGLKVVHISDIHYGQTVNEKEFNMMVEKINAINPDIVVLTGDLFDRDILLNKDQIKNLTDGLKNIKAKINKYAIMGNHDFKHKEWEDIIEIGEFINLNDTYDLIYSDSYKPMMISGMSTNLHGAKKIDDKIKTTTEYLESVDKLNTENSDSTELKVNVKPTYKILIMHEPDFIDEFDYKGYDLILAGHSHNGQVRLPFIGAMILPEGARKYYNEHYKVNNTDLYISSGTGTSTINFRLFNRPSINFYRLTNR